MELEVPLIRLHCGVNSYDWGKRGTQSTAAKCAAATSPDDFTIHEDKPYSELWMGTHHSLPSRDVVSKRTLLELVKENKGLLSLEICERFGDKLPFLLKVLSIHKALSIQAHPDKALAKQLHAKDSKNYPDDNHKPEMTIAISPFDGLCGFRPLAEISHFLTTVPSLRKLVGEAAAQQFQSETRGRETSDVLHDVERNKAALKAVFAALMRSQPADVEAAAKELVDAAQKEGEQFAGGGGPANTGKVLADLVVRLNEQFPGDIGLFVQFFLNYVTLQPGEAMFLKANDVHAYLSGEVVECMASSDNVVRAGLTPKFKDVETLVSMLTYNYAPISEQKMAPVPYPYATLSAAAYSSNSSCVLYDPPIDEFSVVMTELKRKGAKTTFEGIAGPSIVLCTQGAGAISVGRKTEEVQWGQVFFVGAGAQVILESASDEPFVTFKAFCELSEKVDERNGQE